MKYLRALLMLVALASLAQPAVAAEHPHYGDGDLDQMLAPIALYPDSVLSHVLIAATYPLDVARAARWSRQHPDLAGEDAVEAVDGRDWDASVKALVAFPEILARMDDDLDWTERLGEAFLDDQGRVMDRVQFLRDRAYDSGRLDSMDQVRVVREREIIYIEPAVTDIVYVPYYDPWYVYGSWWWPSYPPYCWNRWHGHAVSYYGPGFYWGTGFRVAPTFYFTSFYWPQRQVVVVHDRSRPAYSGRDLGRQRNFTPWQHSADRVSGMHYRTERRAERRDGSRPADERVQRPSQWRDDDARAPQQWREEERREAHQPSRPASRRDERGERSPRSDRDAGPPRWSNAREDAPARERVERGEVQHERPEPQGTDTPPPSRGQELRETNRGREQKEERGPSRRPRQDER